MTNILKTLLIKGGEESQIHIWEFVFATALYLVCWLFIGLTVKFSPINSEENRYALKWAIITGLVVTILTIVVQSDFARVILVVGMFSISLGHKIMIGRLGTLLYFGLMTIAFCIGARFYFVGIMTMFLTSVVIMFQNFKKNSHSQ